MAEKEIEETEEALETPADEHKSLEDRLEALERAVTRFITSHAPGEAKPPTRAQKEASVEQMVAEQVSKLREQERSDQERSSLIAKIDKLEQSMKQEKPPITYSAIARFFFGDAD